MRTPAKAALAAIALLVLAIPLLVLWLNRGESAPAESTAGTDLDAGPAPTVLSTAVTVPGSPLTPEEERLGTVLQQKYGKKTGHPYWRLHVIEALKKYLVEHYPNDWRERLKRMLTRFFPADADALLAAFDAYEQYNDWVGSMKTSMTFSTPEERMRAIWDKRHQLFGDDAEIIWATQRQQEKVDSALKQLDASSLPFAAKVDSYVKTLNEVYGAAARDPERSHPVQRMEGLLALPSVQDQLHEMSPDRRKEELHHLRAALGLDAETIKRWDELDSERATRAANGVTYMKEREQLARQYQGEVLQLHIQALQIRLFGAEEAQYLRNEEETGYFRYQDRQQIGIN